MRCLCPADLQDPLPQKAREAVFTPENRRLLYVPGGLCLGQVVDRTM